MLGMGKSAFGYYVIMKSKDCQCQSIIRAPTVKVSHMRDKTVRYVRNTVY